jgi:hypothetical protein
LPAMDPASEWNAMTPEEREAWAMADGTWGLTIR